MPITSEKLKSQQELPEIKKVKTDPSNLFISRDDFIAKRRKEQSLAARMEIEKAKIEKELEAEGAAEAKARKKAEKEAKKLAENAEGNTEKSESNEEV